MSELTVNDAMICKAMIQKVLLIQSGNFKPSEVMNDLSNIADTVELHKLEEKLLTHITNLKTNRDVKEANS